MAVDIRRCSTGKDRSHDAVDDRKRGQFRRVLSSQRGAAAALEGTAATAPARSNASSQSSTLFSFILYCAELSMHAWSGVAKID